MNHIVSPEANAAVSEWFGEAPSNAKACDVATEGHCETFHAGDEAYAEQLYYWNTPISACLDGRTDVECTTYDDWTKAWIEIKGCRRRAPNSRSSGTKRRCPLLHRHPRLRLGAAPRAADAVAGGGLPRRAGARCSSPRCGRSTSSPARSSGPGRWTTTATLLTQEVYRTITLRTLGIAVFVTVVDALLALPIAFYMAKIASPRAQKWLVIAVLTPLWASYLVKAYSWRAMFSATGPIAWVLEPFGLSSPGYGLTATVVTLTYLWLPYMILPMYAGLERLPNSLLEASADLGAGTWPTLRRIVLPVMFPALVAGSIFTFSLTLGDYIAVEIVGGTNQMLGNVVYDVFLTANNMPFAAAVSTIPVVIMTVYLLGVRRTGAVENL